MMAVQFVLPVFQQPLVLVQQQLRYSITTLSYGVGNDVRFIASSSRSHRLRNIHQLYDICRGRLIGQKCGFSTTTGNNSYYIHKSTPYTNWRCNNDAMLQRTRISSLPSKPMMRWMRWRPKEELNQCRRTFAAAAWWRGLGGVGKSSNSKNYSPAMVLMDVSKKRQYPMTIVNDEYRISICSIQGYRKYMEDEFMIHTTTTTTTTQKNNEHHDRAKNHVDSNSSSDDDISDGIVGCFDGHGGMAVSRYLRQNLYINLQAALQMIQQTKPVVVVNPLQSSVSIDDTTIIDDDNDDDENENTSSDFHVNDEGHPNTNLDENNINNLKIDDSYLVSGIPSTTTIVPPPTAITKNNTTTSSIMSSSSSTATIPVSSNSTFTNTASTTASVDDYVSALEVALDKVDREVLKVKHWRHQGSTAIVCWIHTAIVTTANESPSSTNLEESTDAGESMIPNETEVDDNSSSIDDPPINKSKVRTLITANIGDSRAILCRNGVAIALSRDHKPNDPIEYQRIRQLGGTVVWDGEVDRMREPIPGMGCYRVNGNLALSRVIGDRSFRPVVNSDPDITLITLLSYEDEFIVVATDGLWDVMSSSDTVAFIHAILDNMDQDTIDRDSIATYVVEEALRRGSQDNITVIIVWLK